MHIHSALSLLTFLTTSALATTHNTGQVPLNQNLTTMPKSEPKLYFAYGSNLWLNQMSTRCPSAQYLGVARLDGYTWMINERGYANIVERGETPKAASSSASSSSKPTKPSTTTSPKSPKEPSHDKEEGGDAVWGLVYSLTKDDERKLDRNEGVPVAYTKEDLHCVFWSAGAPSPPLPLSQHAKIDTSTPSTDTREMLVYIDRKRTTPDEPRKEYVYRMNQGISDAVRLGVPEKYGSNIMRVFIPEEEGEKRKSTEEFAKRQAGEFRDESGVFR
jgi:gamma-glutamylcyclotransferase